MESRIAVNAFEKLMNTRKEMRLDDTRDQLRMIEENQRAASLVRLFQQGEVTKVRKLATAY